MIDEGFEAAAVGRYGRSRFPSALVAEALPAPLPTAEIERLSMPPRARVSFLGSSHVVRAASMRRRSSSLGRTVSSLALPLVGVIASLVAAASVPAQTPQWIWNHPQAATSGGTDPAIFRRSFSLESDAAALVVTVACDNRYELFVDGVAVGRGENWQRPERFVIRGNAVAGEHVVTIRGINDGPDPAGLAVTIERQDGERRSTIAVSDGEWSAAREADIDEGWRRRELSSTDGWGAASVLGPVGSTAPWLDRVAWSEPSAVELTRAVRPAQERFEFLDGDRVTLIGGTWIERLQQDQYFETLVTAAYPDRKIVFRNLGWSGDEVTGIARAVFGSPQDGFRRLQDDLIRTAPNVILIGYGGNEAFGGAAGLDSFRRDWLRLTEFLESTGATLVFLSPIHHERLGPPLPDPTAINAEIDRYASAIGDWARERGHHYIDLRDPVPATAERGYVPDIRDRLTDNGVHFTEYGNWRVAFALAERLGVPVEPWSVSIDLAKGQVEASAGRGGPVEVVGDRVRFEIDEPRLPLPPPPRNVPRGGELTGPPERLTIAGLAPGTWGLSIDGQPTILADARQWAEGMTVPRGETIARIEQLRRAIATKNELHFHRYRPQNETYLFLFRKHEQGNNAVEIPQFDPLIERQELLIDELKQSGSVRYELIRIPDGE